MLFDLALRILAPSAMRTADRLIAAHGPRALELAKAGVRGNHESDGVGLWSDVRREIMRRTVSRALWSRCR